MIGNLLGYLINGLVFKYGIAAKYRLMGMYIQSGQLIKAKKWLERYCYKKLNQNQRLNKTYFKGFF